MQKVQGPDGRVHSFPDGATPEQMKAALSTIYQVSAQQQPPQPSGGSSFSPMRQVELAAGGVADSVLEAAGAIPDLVATGMRNAGLPAPEAGFYTNKLKSGWRSIGEAFQPVYDAAGIELGPQAPQDDTERAVVGAGNAIGDAATFMVPGAMLAKSANNPVTREVGKRVAAQPAMQTAAAATGGAVAGATNDPWLGLAASIGTPMSVAAARRAVTPFPSQLNANEQRLAAAATDSGIPLTPGQQTGSRPLQTTESVLAQTPFSSTRQNAIYDTQREAFTRAVLAKAGIHADEASTDVIASARSRLGDQFKRLAGVTEVNVDNAFFEDVQHAARKYSRRLTADQKPVFQSYVDDLDDLRKAAEEADRVFIPGQQYQEVTSDLKARMRTATDPEFREALGGLVEAMDGAMERSMRSDVASQWRQVRQQWRNLLVIDDAMRGGTADSRSAAQIPFGTFKSAVVRNDKSGFSQGRGDLNELARIGDFLAPRIPNSGTPERQRIQSLLTGGFGGFGAGAVSGDPITGLAAGATALTLPPMLQTAINSPAGRAYLTNQLFASRAADPQLMGKIAITNMLGKE